MPRNIVMVVEDEPMNRLLAVDMFERAGFEVVDFGCVDAAISFAAEAPDCIAAVFTDVNVPGDHDGIDLAHEFTRRWPSALIMVTSGCFGDEMPQGLPASIHYVPKPWCAKTLVEDLRVGLLQQ